ncbi:hypothetical protein V7S43_005011 [Phytophthora oleae]|uniref:PDZ domain-containing protein n=1 Tax=Phytophthora oleae TaxID=2107226 RepID=A0ABD3FVD2_9STRA
MRLYSRQPLSHFPAGKLLFSLPSFMVDAEAQTEPTLPASVVGLEKDVLIGTRIRKSFGSGAFWGSVVGCYWVSGGLFYKVSFDDGDVDIFSVDEVLQDAQEAKKHAKENPQKEKGPNETAVDDYFNAMRVNILKRKRDDVVDHTLPNIRRVDLWGQRLYASIYTNDENETFIKELLKTEDGKIGEMEATGQVKVGDMILAVNQTRVLGMVSKDLAELIRKPKRPVTLTFFRPQRSQLPAESDPTQGEQVQPQAQQQTQAPAATQPQQVQQSTTSATQTQEPPVAVTAQTQQTTMTPVVPPPPRQQVSAPVAMPSSFVRPQQAFVQGGQLAQGLAHQWMNSSQPFTTRDIVRQRVIQNAVVRHGNFMPGYRGVYTPAPSNMVPFQMGPPPYGGDFSVQQYLQGVADTAAMRARSGLSAPSVQSRRIPVQHVQQRNTDMTLQEKVQQLQSYRNSDPRVSKLTTQATTTDAGSNEAQEVSIIELERRTASQASHQASSQASSADNIRPHDSNGTRRLSTSTLEAIAKLAETNPKAAQQFMQRRSIVPNEPPADAEMEEDSAATSFLSPSALTASDPKPTERDSSAATHSMSFLSPHDFNVESSTPSQPEVSAANTTNQSAGITSNVSLVSLEVYRRRLYLTLGVQGTLIAVTSFVLDEYGLPGEVEKSGKVFLGDVLVRINDRRITPGMTPSHVAEIVNGSSRPMTLLFERASWDILDGQA